MKCLRISCLLSFLVLALAACSSSSSAPDVSKPAGGKADNSAMEKICSAYGLPAQCDACAVADWYNDGVCDTFCQWPDPDCSYGYDGGPNCDAGYAYGADGSIPNGDASTWWNSCNHYNDWDAGDGYVPTYPDASIAYPDASSWGADGSVP